MHGSDSSLIVAHGAFAIAYEWLTSESREPSLSYHFRVGDSVIGTTEHEQSLSSALADVSQLLRHEGNRRRDAWLELPGEQLLGRLQAALIVDFDPAIDPGPHWDQHSRFLALPAESPAFAGWSGFLIEASDVARLLWAKNERRASVHEARLAPGDFEAALKQFRFVLEERRSIRQSVPPASGERAMAGAPASQRKSAS